MKIKYDHDDFSTRSLKWMKNGEDAIETIQIANDILDEYAEEGYILTLRQLYYQLVGRGLTKENTERAYKNLGVLITKARNNGLLSWEAIEDRARGVKGIYDHEEDDNEVVYGLEGLLTIDHWKRQPYHVEVMVEKEALINVIGKACDALKVPYMATKGYLSASEAWRTGMRFKQAARAGKRLMLVHLADHDPEGIDMTRDVEQRIEKYSGYSVDVRRVALTMEQVKEYSPPPNFAKASSTRFEGYFSEFGEHCWELDALEPSVIVGLIRQEIEPVIDQNEWNGTHNLQRNKRYYLKNIHTYWDEIKSYIDELENDDG